MGSGGGWRDRLPRFFFLLSLAPPRSTSLPIKPPVTAGAVGKRYLVCAPPRDTRQGVFCV